MSYLVGNSADMFSCDMSHISCYFFSVYITGGHVIMACRDMEDCEKARATIRHRIPNKMTECRELDLASLESIRKFADGVLECKN